MNSNNSVQYGSGSTTSGIGFTGLLTIVFIVLKLTGYIDWSWWWVLSPLWIGWIVGLVFLVFFFCVVGILKVAETSSRKRRHKRIVNARRR